MKLILNGIEADGITGDVVMSFVSNNLRDISTRNSNYSNTFSLAITNTNRQIFESAEVVTSESVVVYRKLTAQILVDGFEVVNGLAILKGSKELYSVAVFSGGIDFIQSIKDFDLELIRDEIDSLDHTNLIASINARRFNKTDVVYPNIDYGYFERWSLGFTSIPQYFFFPAIYTKWLLDKVFYHLGYSYEGELFEGEVWNNLALPCYNIQDQSFFEVDYSKTIVAGDISGTESYITFPIENTDDNILYKEFVIPVIGTVHGYDLTGYDTGDRFSLECLGTLDWPVILLYAHMAPDLEVRLRIIDKTDGTIKGDTFVLNYSPSKSMSFDFVVYSFNDLGVITPATDVLVWYFKSTANAGIYSSYTLENLFTANQITFNLKQYKAVGTVFVRMYESLPDFKVSDLLKAVLNIEGAFIKIDDSIKKITAYYYEDIRKNKGRAYDWSDLLDLSEEPEITYRMSEYAQDSVFKYTNDDEDIFLSEEFGQGSITVDDQTLDNRKEVLTVPFSLCNVGATAEDRITMGKIYTGEKWIKDDLGNFVIDQDAKVDNFKPRLVQLTDSSSEIYIAGEVVQSRDVINTITFDKVIPKRYGLVTDILNRTKIVNALFRLKVNDVYNLDHSIPVYVKHFNEYFFINDVKQFNFTSSQSTMVELIRI